MMNLSYDYHKKLNPTSLAAVQAQLEIDLSAPRQYYSRKAACWSPRPQKVLRPGKIDRAVSPTHGDLDRIVKGGTNQP
jgi:hypothetical protein